MKPLTNDIQMRADGYVTVDGLSVAYVDSTGELWIDPENWGQATEGMTAEQEGALSRLIRTHVPSALEVIQ